ncbi:MAG: hypothetical protein Q8O89_06280 [Nanoarchaeota archaeon]|nr:hypothetical protein [Nanoarchaeota archaeon]
MTHQKTLEAKVLAVFEEKVQPSTLIKADDYFLALSSEASFSPGKGCGQKKLVSSKGDVSFFTKNVNSFSGLFFIDGITYALSSDYRCIVTSDGAVAGEFPCEAYGNSSSVICFDFAKKLFIGFEKEHKRKMIASDGSVIYELPFMARDVLNEKGRYIFNESETNFIYSLPKNRVMRSLKGVKKVGEFLYFPGGPLTKMGNKYAALSYAGDLVMTSDGEYVASFGSNVSAGSVVKIRDVFFGISQKDSDVVVTNSFAFERGIAGIFPEKVYEYNVLADGSSIIAIGHDCKTLFKMDVNQ